MASDVESSYSLRLGNSPIRFEPVSKVTHVFFDDANKQVFAIRGSGATGVVVKGPTDQTSLTFRIEDKGPVTSVKFSPDQKVLAVQRALSSVEFVNIIDGESDIGEYSQICKGKMTKIQGFVWINSTEIVFITDHGMECYQVIPEKKMLKLLKTCAFKVNWFVYLAKDGVLVLSLGSFGNELLPFIFKGGNVYKQPKFEVDLPAPSRTSRPLLLERDVILANIYGQIYITVLRHQPRVAGTSGAEVVLYTLQKDSPARKTNILKLEMSGRFAVNIVDNLIVVHNQASKTSAVFDIGLKGESDGYVNYHSPVASPLPMEPFKIKVPVVPTRVPLEEAEVTCEMYSPNWVVFQPNIIIDAKIGCLWYLELRLENIISLIPDKCRLIDFLLCRDPISKPVLLKVFRDLLLQHPRPPISLLACVFDRLNVVYRTYLESETHNLQASLAASTSSLGILDGCLPQSAVFVSQIDMYSHVFTIFAEKEEKHSHKFVVAVVIEYIRSLSQAQIPVEYFLYELVITTLVNHQNFYQLHQLLQYHVLSDSKPLACLLLSLEGTYPPAHQLALDMLKRLNTANEEIIEVLLSKQLIIPALRFIRNAGNIDNISPRKFLESALNTNDPLIFYSVFKLFEQRNIRLRGKPQFAKGEYCEHYIKHFEVLFGAAATHNVAPSENACE